MTDLSGGWSLTEHACRACLGRILQRGSTFVCAICGDESTGSPAGICGCGIRIDGATGRAAGFRCQSNPARSPASPAIIVIGFGADGGSRGR